MVFLNIQLVKLSSISTVYSVLQKSGFKVMKVNFYHDIIAGFELVRSYLTEDDSDYTRSVLAIDLQEPEDKTDYSATTRYERKVAAYLCCLYQAGFRAPKGFRVRFSGNSELNQKVRADGSLDPTKNITLEEASDWFSTIWDIYESDPFFATYRCQKGHEWADEDLKALLVFLTRKTKPGGSANVSGYRKLRPIADLHTETVDKPFDQEIIEELRAGRIIIIDLSQGDPQIQQLYSERICRFIFNDAMRRFIANKPNNFIQFYFEEAHNLFPKKEDKDLSQIYNRLAKEGAKLNIGLVYATQEVSSISSNILKNTQNWFIAHLNNEDETKEIKKYYDFGDFTESLVRFSESSDKGFVRMKTYSNPFVLMVRSKFGQEIKSAVSLPHDRQTQRNDRTSGRYSGIDGARQENRHSRASGSAFRATRELARDESWLDWLGVAESHPFGR